MTIHSLKEEKRSGKEEMSIPVRVFSRKVHPEA